MVYSATLFNTDPYWDDFNEDKKFLRMLFRPGRAVQARELTQLQTIVQDQIKVRPIYKKFDGWLKNTSGIKKWKDLPKNAQKYVKFIKDFCNVEISSVSTSPKRQDTILLKNPFKN